MSIYIYTHICIYIYIDESQLAPRKEPSGI